MQQGNPGLAFEQPIYELEGKLDELVQSSGDNSAKHEQIRELRSQLAGLTEDIYSNLTPWQTVQVARHQDRPYTSDYLGLIFDEFVELHGDRRFGDDRALISGFAKIGKYKTLIVGHQKGRTYKERTACYFGCAHPEGYRKALLKMRMAAKYGLPVICLIDTPGAYPGLGAEERGQSQAIAENMYEMSRLKTPIIGVVIGEGGSGGALGIGVGDRVGLLEFSYYSVISPEGCSGILWKNHEYAEQAAKALRFTAPDLLELGVVDEVIKEPLGGAHRDHHKVAANLKRFLLKTLGELTAVDGETLLADRYEKFRRMGRFREDVIA
jgi:acetyl-CoA carboxylase carboxyl transferase subunit alpha